MIEVFSASEIPTPDAQPNVAVTPVQNIDPSQYHSFEDFRRAWEHQNDATIDISTQSSPRDPTPSSVASSLSPQEVWVKSNIAPPSVQDILHDTREITPEKLAQLQNALNQKVQWDSNLPSFIADIRVGDLVRYHEANQSVTILNRNGTLKLKIVFKDVIPRQSRNTPFGRKESLGDFLARRGPTQYKKNSCGASVGSLLNEYGLKDVLPQSGRDGKNWDTILETPPLDLYFDKIPCALPTDAQPGDICVYDEHASRGSSARKKYGHVEIRGNDGRFYSYYASEMPGGSSKTREQDPEKYRQLTGFTGYVYRMKNLG